MKNLEMIKKMVAEDIQEAMDKLIGILIELEDEDMIDSEEVFYNKYSNGEFFKCEGVIKDIDLHLMNNYYYEYKRLEDGLVSVKEITQESILNTIAEIEDILKVA